MNVVRRLKAFAFPDDDNGDFADTEFGLGDLPLELLDVATDLVLFLESINWKWDIKTVLEQPADIFHAVMRIKVTLDKIRIQMKNKKPSLAQ